MSDKLSPSTDTAFPTRPRPLWLRSGLLLLLLLAFALRLHDLTRQDIWWDEARNIDVALRPFGQIAVAPELDIHPPFYFWLLHFWSRLAGIVMGQPPAVIAFVTRYLSVFWGVIGVALLYPLARTASGRTRHDSDESASAPASRQASVMQTAGLFALTIGSLSPFWLAESQETRMYTLGFALLAGAAVAWSKGQAAGGREQAASGRWQGAGGRWQVAGGKEQGAGGRRQVAGQSPNLPISQSPIFNLQSLFPTPYSLLFTLLSALALLTHYNAVFILAAWYMGWGAWALLQPDRWRRMAILLASGLLMTLLVAPVAPIALRQIPEYANPNLRVPTLIQYLVENARAYVGGYAFDAADVQQRIRLWLALFLPVPGLFLALRRRSERNVSALLVWLLGGLALYYIAVLDRGAFNVRYSSFVTPALYALMGIGLAALGSRRRSLAVAGVALVLVTPITGVYADFTDTRFARENISGVTDWLRANAGPDDVIFVDQKYPFGFYYQRYAIDPDVEPTGVEAAPARYLFVDINAIDGRLNEWAADAAAVYWVQWFESDTDPRRAVPFLLDQAGAEAGEKTFQGYVIEWWELEPPNHFELAHTFVTARYAWPPAVETVELAVPAAPVAPGDVAPVVIRWQRASDEPAGRPLKARVALYDADGGRKVQADERILNDRHLMPDEWSLTDQPLNVYRLQISPDLPSGAYELRLLVYDADTLEAIGPEEMIGYIKIED